MGIIIDTESSFKTQKKMSEVAKLKKQIWRGIELDKLLEMSSEEIVGLMNSRQKRRYRHGIQGKYDRLLKKLRKSKLNIPAGEKPKGVKTHLRNCIVVPEMCNS